MAKSKKQYIFLQKLRRLNLGRKHNPETIKKLKEIRNNPIWKKKVYTKIRNRKISKAMMGNKNGIKFLWKGGWNGKKHTEKTKRKMRENWERKEYREKLVKNCLKRLKDRPTSLEQKAIKIIQENNLPYKYVGDGSFLIGYKNPDFIHLIDKTCLEVCNYFHHQGNYKENRIKYFAKWGWNCFVFYEDELGKMKETLCMN